MMDDDEPTIIKSPLSRRIEQDGTFIDVEIFRGAGDDGWILEVVDEEDASTVFHQPFATEQEALDEVLRVIASEGIRTFLEGGAADFSGTVH